MKRPIMILAFAGLLTACTTTAPSGVANPAIWFSTMSGEQSVDGAEPTTPYQWELRRDGHGQFAVLRSPFPDAATNSPRMVAYQFQLNTADLQRFADLIQDVRTAANNPPEGACPIMNATIDSIDWAGAHAGRVDVDHCFGPRRIATLNRALNILRRAARLPTSQE